MGVHSLTLRSSEEGGDTDVIIKSNAAFTNNFTFQKIDGGVAEVKISSISLSDKVFHISRNQGDGTHFNVTLHFTTDDPTVALRVSKFNNHGSITYSTGRGDFVHTAAGSVDIILDL